MKKTTTAFSRKKKKRSPLQIAKDKAWTAFSRHIRARDCLATTGTDDYGVCITCGRTYPFGELQAGHFIAGRRNSVLFDPTNCHAQCYGCNISRNGNGVYYTLFMQKRYGQDHINELIRKNNTVRVFTVEELANLEKLYKESIVYESDLLDHRRLIREFWQEIGSVLSMQQAGLCD